MQAVFPVIYSLRIMNIPALHGTYAEEIITELTALYAEVEEATVAFTSEYGIACPFGCGTCCEHFVPDITASEAVFVAAYILFEMNDPELRTLPQSSSGCPLYRPDSPYHCSVYPARPLICRLYAASAYHDKYGKTLFRSCKYEETKQMPALIHFEKAVVTMQDYAYRLRSIDRDGGEVALLTDLVPELLDQLQFIASFTPIIDNPETPLAG